MKLIKMINTLFKSEWNNRKCATCSKPINKKGLCEVCIQKSGDNLMLSLTDVNYCIFL